MANWANVARLGNPLAPGWQDQNLAWIEPAPGQRWQVYKPAAQAFNGLLGDLIANGYQPHSSGGFNYRNIRGGSQLSQHAFGTAIDINADTNPMLARGQQVVTDLPANTAELAKKWGLEWGGTWKRPDAMHFEWAGGGAPDLAPGGPSTSTSVASLFPSPGVQPALQGEGGAVAAAQPTLGNIALLFAQQQAQRQQQKQDEADAEQERKRALFSADSLAGLFGAA